MTTLDRTTAPTATVSLNKNNPQDNETLTATATRADTDGDTVLLTYTWKVNGVTRKTYGSLKSDYLIDPQVISTEVGGENGSLANDLRHNLPPDVKVDGPLTRTAKVGQPLSIVTIAGDPDNLPPRRDGKPQPGVVKAARAPLAPRPGAAPNSPAVVYRPPVAVVASAGPGLHLSWIVYRGKATAVKLSSRRGVLIHDVAAGPGHPPVHAVAVAKTGSRRSHCGQVGETRRSDGSRAQATARARAQVQSAQGGARAA